jgi:CTP synthase (UTP-ammonia lyase)
MLIGVVGDHNSENETHATLDASLEAAGAEWEWVPTDAVPAADALEERYAGLWVAPASPYRSMDGALEAVRVARERGVPLVGT